MFLCNDLHYFVSRHVFLFHLFYVGCDIYVIEKRNMKPPRFEPGRLHVESLRRDLSRPYTPFGMLFNVDDGDLRHGPAVIGTGHLELHHRDRVGGAAHNTQPTTDALLLVDNHVGSTAPAFGTLVHRVALYDARETFHTDAVIRADVYAARAENTD